MTRSQSRPAPQWARVLFELRRAGRAGITTNFIRNGMVPPIANPAQRIIELEARGHVISSTPEKREGHATVARYRLERDAARSSTGAGGDGGGSRAATSAVSDSDPISGQRNEAPATTLPFPATGSPTDGETFETALAQLKRPAAYDPFNEEAA